MTSSGFATEITESINQRHLPVRLLREKKQSRRCERPEQKVTASWLLEVWWVLENIWKISLNSGGHLLGKEKAWNAKEGWGGQMMCLCATQWALCCAKGVWSIMWRWMEHVECTYVENILHMHRPKIFAHHLHLRLCECQHDRHYMLDLDKLCSHMWHSSWRLEKTLCHCLQWLLNMNLYVVLQHVFSYTYFK